MVDFFPGLFDGLMQPLETLKLHSIRRRLLSYVTGSVLEIGSGTGVNFPYYRKGAHVEAIDPDPAMIRHAKARQRAALVPITMHQGDAEVLPFQNQSFDVVVATLVFCTILDPKRALAEIQRVAKPGAEVIFFEHVRMPQSALAKLQDTLTPAWRKICDGCHLNRDTLALVKQSSLEIRHIKSYSKGLFLEIRCHAK